MQLIIYLNSSVHVKNSEVDMHFLKFARRHVGAMEIKSCDHRNRNLVRNFSFISRNCFQFFSIHGMTQRALE